MLLNLMSKYFNCTISPVSLENYFFKKKISFKYFKFFRFSRVTPHLITAPILSIT